MTSAVASTPNLGNLTVTVSQSHTLSSGAVPAYCSDFANSMKSTVMLTLGRVSSCALMYALQAASSCAWVGAASPSVLSESSLDKSSVSVRSRPVMPVDTGESRVTVPASSECQNG